jgi:hypothetical protein
MAQGRNNNGSKKHGPTHILWKRLRIIQRDFCAIEIKCSLIPPHFIEVLVPSQGSELTDHVFVVGVSILLVVLNYTLFQ